MLCSPGARLPHRDGWLDPLQLPNLRLSTDRQASNNPLLDGFLIGISTSIIFKATVGLLLPGYAPTTAVAVTLSIDSNCYLVVGITVHRGHPCHMTVSRTPHLASVAS